jgi:LuxR family maltose regulon positive regulatory protein
MTRLKDGIDSGARLTLVAAPVGYGKTSLLASWLATTTDEVAWLSLEAEDNEPIRFWTYAIAALQTVRPELGQQILNLLQAAPNPSLDFVVADLINEIATSPTQVILVLDDFHAIENPAIHRTIEFLVAHQPSQLHLAILTREDPPLPLAQLRAKGQMVELRGRDLQFSREEAAELLLRRAKLSLSPGGVEALQGRTEGWVAGLQMAALSLQHITDPESFIAAFAGDHRHVADYLISEVLERQSPEIRDFLMRTAVVDRFTAGLCQALTGGTASDAQATIEQAESLGLFVVPLDHNRRWYRYHHLFAGLLRLKLRQEQPGVHADLNLRASRWCEKEGLADEAIKYALAGGNHEEAARLIEAVGLGMVGKARFSALQAWIDSLPRETVEDHPHLAALLAWVGFLTGQPQLAARNLELARAHMAPSSAKASSNLRAEIALLEAYAARNSGDLDLSIERTLQAQHDLRPGNVFLDCTIPLNLGGNYWLKGDFEGLEEPLKQAASFAGNTDAQQPALAAAGFLANGYLQRGQLNTADALCRRMLEHADRNAHPAGAYVYLEQGELLYERNELDAALESLTRAIELGENADRIVNVVRARQVLARVHYALGNEEEAEDLTAQAAELYQQYSPRFQLMRALEYDRYRVTGLLQAGKLEPAAQWAEGYEGSRMGMASPWRIPTDLLLARIRIIQGRLEAAAALVDACAESARDMGAGAWLLRSRLAQCLCLLAAGSTSDAESRLRECLGLAEPEGYVRTFVEHGAPIEKLLWSMADAGTSRYVDRLLKAFPGPQDDEEAAPAKPVLDNLTDQETKLLRLMAAGLSHSEIAQELFISLNTVKWHTAHIYRKLSVHRRARAVARGRELGLL